MEPALEGPSNPVELVFVVEPKHIFTLIQEAFLTGAHILDPLTLVLIQLAI